ncbi:MAG: hypothetical protein IJU98_07095, partial [Synergistaceae bacterium]|nr:hypothetical protein [Synergistaceae bacterium]
ELGEKLAKGEVNPDDIVGEDPVVFVPRDALSDTALLELAGDEVLEEVEETEAGAPVNVLTDEATEEETEEVPPDGLDEDNKLSSPDTADSPDAALPAGAREPGDLAELAVRQSTWDAWAAEHPEEAEGLKDHVRVGTRGVTAAEEFARKFDTLRKKAEDKLNADTPEAETARGIRDEVKAQLAEINKGLAKPLTGQAIEDEANIYGHMLLNTAENYGVSPEEVHRLRVKNGQDPVGKRERYNQIIGPRGAAKLDAADAGHRIDNTGNLFDEDDRTGNLFDEDIQTKFPRVYREEQSAYDPDDPATWPEGPARDEALELKAWLDWDMLEEYKYLPDSVPEKAEALALMKEFNELDAWFEAADIETVKNDVEHNDHQNQIEKRLDEIDRILKKKMPKGAERRLEKLIEAEAQEAEREFQLYDEIESETDSFSQLRNQPGMETFYQAQTNAQARAAEGLGRKTSITDVVNAAKTKQGKKNPEQLWYDYARVTPEEAQRISQATGLDIDERYVHTFVGNGVTHTEKRHGIGNEKRHDQAPITAADYELVPYIIQNADKIALGTEKSTSGNNTIVYLKKIDGNTLVVEEVRSKRGKLAFYAMRKAKAGYTYDLTKPGHPIIKETAGSQGVTSKNAAQPEVGSPNAPSVATSLQQTGEDVNDATRGDVEFGPFSHTEAAIRMGTKADASTFLHELWHVALDDLLTFGRRETASEQSKVDMTTAMEWLGLTESDLENSERMREAQEKWAEAGESYFMSGKAPTTALQGVFERIRK